MATIIIRDLPDSIVAQLDARAAAADKSREAWIRDLLTEAVYHPIIKDAYRLVFYTKAEQCEVSGYINRDPSDPLGVVGDLINPSQCAVQAQQAALHRAMQHVKRNGPGDREQAYGILAHAFQVVMEVPPLDRPAHGQ